MSNQLYTHVDMDGVFGVARFTLPDGRWFPASWWGTVTQDEIEALGFVAHVPPEPDPPTLEERKAGILSALAHRRWQFEVSGFVWQRTATEEFYFIATDEVSQGKIAAERKAAEDAIRRPGDVWKCGDAASGQVVYVTFSDAEIVAMSDAARHRTSDGFNHEATIAAMIVAAADHAVLDLIDIEAGWP